MQKLPQQNKMPDTYTSVGILRKPHGLSGAFSFVLTRELKSLKRHPTHFFLEVRGAYIPYFISKIDLKDIFAGYINFEEVTKLEQAKPLVNSGLYLDSQTVSAFFKKEAAEYDYLIGYTAYDKETALGPISEILSHPAQILVSVTMNGTDVLIPLVDDLVIDIDKRKKKIIFDVPDGLI
jgi:16S rRNA processing protein RimM